MDKQLKALAQQVAQLQAQNDRLVQENIRLSKGYGLSNEAVSMALATRSEEEFTKMGLAELEDYKKLQRNHEKVKETNAKYRRGDIPEEFLSIALSKFTPEDYKNYDLVPASTLRESQIVMKKQQSICREAVKDLQQAEQDRKLLAKAAHKAESSLEASKRNLDLFRTTVNQNAKEIEDKNKELAAKDAELERYKKMIDKLLG